MLLEPSYSKIWLSVPWDSEPRNTLLARTSSNLSVRLQMVNVKCEVMMILSRVSIKQSCSHFSFRCGKSRRKETTGKTKT
jgi:hypothetical protein